MSHTKDSIGISGIQFFGKISAVISHEMRNVYAIINENAGLLEDFSLMVEKGMPIDPVRLNKLARTIQRQVQRGNDMVARMNQFAHSADDPVKNVDLVQMINLMVSLAQRNAAGKNVSLKTTLWETPIQVVTYPFLLENLFWQCLEYAMSVAGSEGAVCVMAEPTHSGAVLRFECGTGLDPGAQNEFPSDIVAAMMNELKISLGMDPGADQFSLAIPRDIQ